MFGSTGTTPSIDQRYLRHRAAAWLAVLAFSLAQILAGAHIHASHGSDEAPEALCAACAQADGEQLCELSPGQAVAPLRQRVANSRTFSILIERQIRHFRPRAPPSP